MLFSVMATNIYPLLAQSSAGIVAHIVFPIFPILGSSLSFIISQACTKYLMANQSNIAEEAFRLCGS